MLTFKKDKNEAIAIINGGELDGNKLYIENDKAPEMGEYVQIMKDNKNICKYCNKILSRKDHLDNHYNTCKQKLIYDALQNAKCEENEFTNQGTELLITDSGILSPLPSSERFVYYIFGPPKSGKSTWIGNFCNHYVIMYPKKDIYLFSYVGKDTALNNKKIKRVKIETLAEDPINDIEDLRGSNGSLCIFDDVINDGKNKLDNELIGLMNTIIRNGRDHEYTGKGKGRDIDVIYTSHTGCNGHKTKFILSVATCITFFCSGLDHGIDYFLNKKIGITDKKKIERIKKLPSRWISLYISRPSHILHEKGALLLKNL